MRVGLVPLDERPVNARFPRMLAPLAGVEVLLPSVEALGELRSAGRWDALAPWLRNISRELNALVVSFEMLGYGGLIVSRTTPESAATVLARLDLLRELRRARPDLRILGSSLLMRVSNANYALEEPAYWEEYGTRFFQLSQFLDREARGEPVGEELAVLRASLPAEAVGDYLRRRLRNHVVNLAALELLDGGVLDLLVLGSDDTSPYGLPSAEKRWLSMWAGYLDSDDRLLMYPGADEVGCALLARAVNEHHRGAPSFEPLYAVPGDEELVAPYEDGPVRLTIERQVRAVGGELGAGEGELLLAVNTPVPGRREWDPSFADEDRAARLPHLERFVGRIRRAQDAGRPVVVADVAYPNGADPVLVDLLRERVDLPALAAYGAWNTAGNTIGTALAQGCLSRYVADAAGREAVQRCLLHRFVEDWGYQHLARRRAREWLRAETGREDPTEADLPAVVAFIEAQLAASVEQLPGFSGRYRIAPGSVRLPWGRLFEVDFDLERTLP